MPVTKTSFNVLPLPKVKTPFYSHGTFQKSWQKKYCILYNKSSTGVARIEIFDSNNSQSHAKIITLEDVIKITKKSADIINVVTKNSTFEFETQSEDFNVWFESLKLVAFSSDTNDETSVEQENDLYCSSDEGSCNRFISNKVYSSFIN